MTIDIQRLRNDIKDNYGTAMFNDFPAAVMDLAKVDRMSDQEIVEYALKKNIRLEKYIIQQNYYKKENKMSWITELIIGEIGDAISSSIAKKRENNYQEKKDQIHDSFIKKHASDTVLFMDRQNDGKYKVYDRNEIIQYQVIDNWSGNKIRILDSHGVEVGLVRKKMIAPRFLKVTKFNPIDFIIEINNDKVGVLKSDATLTKREFVFKNNDWKAFYNLSNTYTIKKKNSIVMEAKKVTWTERQKFMIAIKNQEDILMCVVFMIAMDLARQIELYTHTE